MKTKVTETSTAKTGMAKMRFRAYTDNTFKTPHPNVDAKGFVVLVNPESFERTLSVKGGAERTARPGNSSGHDAGLNAEQYSFDLIFDGTGVAGPKLTGQALLYQFNVFLSIVYANRKTPKSKKKATWVELTYCGETFYCRLNTMTVRYLLFQRDGYPLRIKVSCRFTSVEKPKPDPTAVVTKKEAEKEPAPKDSPNYKFVDPKPTYQETVHSAKENGAVSLMSCSFKLADMLSSTLRQILPQPNH